MRAAIQEDADGIAISSYQGGHVEYFKYVVDMLRERGAGHIRVFGGGGGTITPAEIAELEGYGVERIYHPNDGMELGLTGMIDDLVARAPREHARAPSATAPRSRARRATTWRSRGCSRRSRTACSTRPTLERLRARVGERRRAGARWSASPAPAAPARARSPTSC